MPSIEVLNLNRVEFVEDRRSRIREGDDTASLALVRAGEAGIPIAETLELWLGPRAQYSEAMRQHVRRVLEEYVANLRSQQI